MDVHLTLDEAGPAAAARASGLPAEGDATMTGPAHYVQAEQYATDAITARDNGDFAAATVLAAIAQVHATLAVAAATALDEEYADIRAWRDVTGQD